MKLTHLHLENFRSFETFDLDLDEAITLLVGLNASGKTAVLDALAIALGAWLSGTAQARDEDRPIHRSDARLVRQQTQGLPTANPNFPVVLQATGTIDTKPLLWRRELLHHSEQPSTFEHLTDIQKYAKLAEKAATQDPQSALPLIAYYGTGRLWVHEHGHHSQFQLVSRMQGYAACLQSVSRTTLFQQWMAWREYARLQRVAEVLERGTDRSTVDTPHLDAVTSAAVSCLEGVLRLFYSANHNELRIELKDGRVLPFDCLSDGQRNLVVLAADLAWRAVQLNPHYGKDAPRLTEGVVLIDEIELHLHPSWQRRIIGDLKETFPRVQFVITTHSPQVISTADAKWLRVLRDSGVGLVEYSRGKDTNAILHEVMGVPERPPSMEDQLARLEAQIEEGDLTEARSLLEDMRTSLGPSDKALSALEWELHDRETADADD